MPHSSATSERLSTERLAEIEAQIAEETRSLRYTYTTTIKVAEARALIAELLSARQQIAGIEAFELSPDQAWQDLLDKDDRTSPEDYPDMALITKSELSDYMRNCRVDVTALQTERDGLAVAFTELEAWFGQNGAHRSHYNGSSPRCSICEALIRGRAALDGNPSPIGGPRLAVLAGMVWRPASELPPGWVVNTPRLGQSGHQCGILPDGRLLIVQFGNPAKAAPEKFMILPNPHDPPTTDAPAKENEHG